MKRKCKAAELAEKEVLEHGIEELEFYNRHYIRASIQTLSYAIPQLVNEVRGSSVMICRAINLLEQVAIATEKRIAELQAELGKMKKEGK